MVWNLQDARAFEIRMADVTIDVILKRAGLFKPDRTIGSFLIHAAQLTSDGEKGACEKTYRSPMSDDNPSLELSIVFSGLPSSSSIAPAQAPSSQQTTTPVDHIGSAVDQAVTNTHALHNPACLEAGIAIIDAVTASVGPVQSAIDYAETLKGTLDCLADCAGYINGVIGLVKDFADIHPISKIAVGALIKVYDLVKTQGRRDESIQEFSEKASRGLS